MSFEIKEPQGPESDPFIQREIPHCAKSEIRWIRAINSDLDDSIYYRELTLANQVVRIPFKNRNGTENGILRIRNGNNIISVFVSEYSFYQQALIERVCLLPTVLLDKIGVPIVTLRKKDFYEQAANLLDVEKSEVDESVKVLRHYLCGEYDIEVKDDIDYRRVWIIEYHLLNLTLRSDTSDEEKLGMRDMLFNLYTPWFHEYPALMSEFANYSKVMPDVHFSMDMIKAYSLIKSSDVDFDSANDVLTRIYLGMIKAGDILSLENLIPFINSCTNNYQLKEIFEAVHDQFNNSLRDTRVSEVLRLINLQTGLNRWALSRNLR